MCQNTNTPNTTGKIWTTRKNYNPKKRYSRLTDGWNKSQITVCRVKIQSHQLQLEKIMTGLKKSTIQLFGHLLCQNTNTTNHTLFKKILIGFLYFTETMRSKLSVTVYLFLALYGSTTIQYDCFSKISRTLFDFRNNTYWVSIF